MREIVGIGCRAAEGSAVEVFAQEGRLLQQAAASSLPHPLPLPLQACGVLQTGWRRPPQAWPQLQALLACVQTGLLRPSWLC